MNVMVRRPARARVRVTAGFAGPAVAVVDLATLDAYLGSLAEPAGEGRVVVVEEIA